MNRTRVRLIPVGFALACSLATNSLIASDGALRVSLDLPAEFPPGVTTIFSGVVNQGVRPATVLSLQHPELGSEILGQIDAATGHVLFPAKSSSAILGRKVALAARIVPPIEHVAIEPLGPGLSFHADDRPVLFYQREPNEAHNHTRAGYVHPLVGLDGEIFTEVFPKDHRHHQGVFWAWHQLWVGDRKIGDPWVTKDHLVVVKNAKIVEQGPVFATLDVQAEWTSTALDESGDAQPIVAEQTRIRVYRAVGDVRYVDFTIQLTALLPGVKLGGSEDAKGYSGFTVRVKPPGDLVIQDASGILEDDAVQTTSPWADVSGSFAAGSKSGLAILTHPSSPVFPARWVLRHYGMQNVAYPGRDPIPLSTENPLVIRHRLVLHRGDADQARIADHQRVYELTRTTAPRHLTVPASGPSDAP